MILIYSINLVPEDRDRHDSMDSLPPGVENMANYMEISSWCVILAVFYCDYAFLSQCG